MLLGAREETYTGRLSDSKRVMVVSDRPSRAAQIDQQAKAYHAAASIAKTSSRIAGVAALVVAPFGLVTGIAVGAVSVGLDARSDAFEEEAQRKEKEAALEAEKERVENEKRAAEAARVKAEAEQKAREAAATAARVAQAERDAPELRHWVRDFPRSEYGGRESMHDPGGFERASRTA